MSYKISVLINAKNELAKRRRNAERIRERHILEATTKIPELKKLNFEMASFTKRVACLIGSGKDAREQTERIAKKSLEIRQRRKDLLVRGGFPEDYLRAKYHCPICSDTGSHDGYYCKCYDELIIHFARKELGSLDLLNASTFENFRFKYFDTKVDPTCGISPMERMKTVFDYCKEYAKKFNGKGEGLLFVGKTGLGKSHLALSIANEVIKKGYNVMYSNIRDLLRKVEKEHFHRADIDESYYDELCEADLLIIDDLGAEFSTSFTVATINNLLNTRNSNNLPTIITTNLMPDEIQTKYSRRFMSRVIGSLVALRFIGSDVRQLKLTMG